MGSWLKTFTSVIFANLIFVVIVFGLIGFGGWWAIKAISNKFPANEKVYKNYVEADLNYEAVPDLSGEAKRLKNLLYKSARGEQLSNNGTFVVIPVIGEISRNADAYQDILAQLLIVARITPDVRAVIFLVDSPGGEVTACDNLRFEIQKLRAMDIQTVTYVRGMSASGAYYITANSDRIIAAPTAMVGSIGVIMRWLNFQGLVSKVGITEETIKSSEMKDIGSPFKKMSKRERKVLQKLITDSFARFKMIVETGRQMTDKQLAAVATGEVWTADDAQKLNLIDDIGYMRDAVGAASELTGVVSPRIVTYRQEVGFWSRMMGDTAINLENLKTITHPETLINKTIPPPVLLYQWIQ